MPRDRGPPIIIVAPELEAEAYNPQGFVLGDFGNFGNINSEIERLARLLKPGSSSRSFEPVAPPKREASRLPGEEKADVPKRTGDDRGEHAEGCGKEYDEEHDEYGYEDDYNDGDENGYGDIWRPAPLVRRPGRDQVLSDDALPSWQDVLSSTIDAAVENLPVEAVDPIEAGFTRARADTARAALEQALAQLDGAIADAPPGSDGKAERDAIRAFADDLNATARLALRTISAARDTLVQKATALWMLSRHLVSDADAEMIQAARLADKTHDTVARRVRVEQVRVERSMLQRIEKQWSALFAALKTTMGDLGAAIVKGIRCVRDDEDAASLRALGHLTDGVIELADRKDKFIREAFLLLHACEPDDVDDTEKPGGDTDAGSSDDLTNAIRRAAMALQMGCMTVLDRIKAHLKAMKRDFPAGPKSKAGAEAAEADAASTEAQAVDADPGADGEVSGGDIISKFLDGDDGTRDEKPEKAAKPEDKSEKKVEKAEEPATWRACMASLERAQAACVKIEAQMSTVLDLCDRVMDLVRTRTSELADCDDEIRRRLGDLVAGTREGVADQIGKHREASLKEAHQTVAEMRRHLRVLLVDLWPQRYRHHHGALRGMALAEASMGVATVSGRKAEGGPMQKAAAAAVRAAQAVMPLVRAMDATARVEALVEYNAALAEGSAPPEDEEGGKAKA